MTEHAIQVAPPPCELADLEEPPSPRPHKKGGQGKRKWAEAAEAEVAERDRWEECAACGRWVNLGRPCERGGELAAPCPGCGARVRACGGRSWRCGRQEGRCCQGCGTWKGQGSTSSMLPCESVARGTGAS